MCINGSLSFYRFLSVLAVCLALPHSHPPLVLSFYLPSHSLILYFWVSAFACLSVLCLPLNCIHLSLQHRQWSFVWYAGVLSMGGAAKGAPAEVSAAD